MSEEKDLNGAENTADTDTVKETENISSETGKPPKDSKKSERKKERELEAENIKLKEALEKAENEKAETEDKYKRILAEYDNF